MPEDDHNAIDQDLARSRRELVLMAEFYLSHGMSDKAQEVMRLIQQIDKHKSEPKSEDSNAY